MEFVFFKWICFLHLFDFVKTAFLGLVGEASRGETWQMS